MKQKTVAKKVSRAAAAKKQSSIAGQKAGSAAATKKPKRRRTKAQQSARRIVNKANSKFSVAMAAWFLSGATFLSMLAGLWRDRLLNANFGVDSLELDAYRVAFTAPDFMYMLMVSGALGVTFIPIFRERLQAGNKKSAWEMTYSMINFLAIITALGGIMLIFAAPAVVNLLGSDLAQNPQATQDAIYMMRLLAFSQILFAISSILTSVQQAVGRFFFFAISPVIYNAGIIIGILWLRPAYGIRGVAYGVIIGTVAQLLISILGMVGLGFSYKFSINRRNLAFRKVIRQLPSRALDQSLDYMRGIYEVGIAGRIGVSSKGAINMWVTASNLHYVPVNLIGVALSTAVFPQMSKRIAQNRSDLFKKDFREMLHVIIWLALPVAMFTFFARGYLSRLLVATGNVTVATLIGILTISIFAKAVFHIVARAFYAQQDIKTPMIISVVTIIQSLVIAWWLCFQVFDADSRIYGLAWAQSISNTTELLLLLIVLEKRFSGIFNREFWGHVGKVFIAVAVTAPIAYGMVKLAPLRVGDEGFFSLATKFGAISIVSGAWYLLVCWALNIPEVQPIFAQGKKILYKSVKY